MGKTMQKIASGFSSSRRSTTRYQSWYGSQRWRKAAKAFLAEPENVLCAWCRPRLTRATQVHHEPDHGGDEGRFWDRSTWVPLCHGCHSGQTRSGRVKGCDEHGNPLDPNSHWHSS
jgi:5-methylcytosine-specific restriction enzyme A